MHWKEVQFSGQHQSNQKYANQQRQEQVICNEQINENLLERNRFIYLHI